MATKKARSRYKTREDHLYVVNFKSNSQPIIKVTKELEKLEAVVLRLKKLGFHFKTS